MRTSASLLVFLFACSRGTIPPEVASPAPATLRKPPLDDRDYRLLKLDNGLQVLLISDADTDTAAAAMNIAVGQFQDPPDREGLAHFLEHMLFMGTDRYPDVDDYKTFISTHGGGSNAATGQESTSYYFTIEQAHLEGGLDRFARFFVAPLLDAAQVERERNAVNSEYQLKLRDEARRLREIRRETSNPDHGFAKFSVGNLDTLADRGDDLVWDDLKAFYETEYSASRMTLSVFGREDLDTLEQLVSARFAEIPTTGAGKPTPSVPAYLDSQQGVRISWTPITDKRELRIELPIPVWTPHFREKPAALLAGLLGQEGEGSLHAALTERGWITALYAGLDGASDHGLLTITTALTEEGFAHTDEIIGLHFQYIRLLQQADDLSPWWEEDRALSELAFAFAEPPPPQRAASAAAYNLQHYPPEHVLDAWATWGSYDPALQADFTDGLVPSAARIFVAGPGLETDQVEALYDVPWSMKPLDPALISAWESAAIDPALTLPALNPYIARDLSLAPLSGEVGLPLQIIDEPGLSVWHLLDPSFGVPRATVRATLIAPAAVADRDARLKAQLLASVVMDALNTELSQLQAAGLSARLSAGDEGFFLQLSGYTDKQDVALAKVLAVLAERPIDPARLTVLRDERVRRWRNSPQDRPNSQVGRALGQVLRPGTGDLLSAADALEAMTAAELEAFSATVFSELSVEVLVHGNHTADDAAVLARSIYDRLGEGEAAVASRLPATVRRLPPGPSQVLDITVDHDDSALRIYYQGEQTDITEQARYLLLGDLLQTPYFSTIRTEQQLGYIAFARYYREDTVPGLHLGVQSSVAAPQTLLSRVDAFLVDFEAELASMDPEAFEENRQALVTNLLEAPDGLNDRTGDLGRDLALGVTSFDRKAQVAAAIATITQEEVLEFYRQRVRSADARRLVIRATGHAHAAAATAEPGVRSVESLISSFPGAFERPRP